MANMRNYMRCSLKRINNDWYNSKPTWVCRLLIPFSLLYIIIIKLRYWLYKYKFLKSYSFSVPVIVVGNITVGGTGKTPLVIYLANYLKSEGFNPGIVSRGYKGANKNFPQQVTANSDPIQVGDEPVLIAKRTGCPVFVDKKRVRAVQALLAKTNCNIVISDDGLQHYQLNRTVEIAVIDGERRLGNELYLPAGPLRENPTRLKTVNFIISNGKAKTGEYEMQLVTAKIYNMKNPELILNTQENIHAVAGMGYPARFFEQLRLLGLNIIAKPFPDHYKFSAEDFNYDGLIIMTEKDAVKCQTFADERYWCLAIDAVLPAEFLTSLRRAL